MQKIFYLILVCFAFVLVSCQNDNETATPIAEAAATATATATQPHPETPTASATATLPPTATATTAETPVPTDTPSPTITPSPLPTATATATTTPTEVPATPTATLAPTSNTLAATTTRSAPPASSGGGSPPTGPNLLNNPGFESGSSSWETRRAYGSPPNVVTYTSSDYANFVHSGSGVATIQGFPNATYFQRISGVTIGETYRAGAWVKIWSSTGEDRSVSENPGDYVVQICINTFGDDDPALPTTVCSGFARPIDSWQYIAINAVATNDRMTVLLRAFFTGSNRPQHNDALWDDVALGLAPAAATPTPAPYNPVRPAPIAFNAVGLRDNMLNLRTNLQNLGGLLDRLTHGQGGTCQEFFDFYNNLVTIITYDGVPVEWQGIYNDYLYAADHAIDTNNSINDLCKNGRGTLTALNYSVARTGVNESVDRLSPAIDAANALLGQ